MTFQLTVTPVEGSKQKHGWCPIIEMQFLIVEDDYETALGHLLDEFPALGNKSQWTIEWGDAGKFKHA